MTATPSDVAAVEVNHLTMRYDQRIVMEDLSFSIAPGEVFVIMGGSGSGKSTLLRHLIGLKPSPEGSAGRVHVVPSS